MNKLLAMCLSLLDGVSRLAMTPYVPVRALGIFEPFVAAVGVTYKVMNGEVKTPEDGLAMMANSLPVVGTNQFYGDAVRDIAKGTSLVMGCNPKQLTVLRTLCLA